jgi:antitoxin MazE
MITKIQKWGNSQGLIVAKPVLKEARLAVGAEVEVLVKAGQIIVRATAKVKTKIHIEDLVAKMPRNYHAKEVGFGPAQGKELW